MYAVIFSLIDSVTIVLHLCINLKIQLKIRIRPIGRLHQCSMKDFRGSTDNFQGEIDCKQTNSLATAHKASLFGYTYAIYKSGIDYVGIVFLFPFPVTAAYALLWLILENLCRHRSWKHTQISSA